MPYKTLHFEKGNKTPTLGRHSFETSEYVKQKPFACFWCNKPGHKISECRKRKRQEANRNSANMKDSETKTNCLLDGSCKQTTQFTRDEHIHPLFKPYCTTAYIVKPDGSSVPIQMLRDTGALQSVLKQSAVDESLYTHTGETRLIKGISREVEIPLVELHLRTSSFDKDVLRGLV